MCAVYPDTKVSPPVLLPVGESTQVLEEGIRMGRNAELLFQFRQGAGTPGTRSDCFAEPVVAQGEVGYNNLAQNAGSKIQKSYSRPVADQSH